VLVPGLVVLFACAKSDGDTDLASRANTDGGTAFVSDGTSPPPPPTGIVYGHSSTMLYRIDTASHAVSEVGYFLGCGHVADIAVDETSTIYASNGAELFVVENNTARCTKVAAGAFPNSLSFVPSGTLGTKETLVGYEGGSYVKIDTASGKTEKVGALGAGLESSGDLVSVRDGKTFVTVKGPDCADCLVEVDPKTGALTKNWGSLGMIDVFGLAFWGGEVYAFSDAGEVALVKLDGDKLTVQKLSVPNAPSDLSFRGAGSTTIAPVGPVR
jgi:hypothetical protein